MGSLCSFHDLGIHQKAEPERLQDAKYQAFFAVEKTQTEEISINE
jgi:hypothetical protein